MATKNPSAPSRLYTSQPTEAMAENWSSSESITYKLTDTWTIDNFSKKVESYSSKSPYISSVPSKVEGNKFINCQLQLYPRGEWEEDREYVSLYLDVMFRQVVVPNVSVTCVLAIVDKSKKRPIVKGMCDFLLRDDM